VTVLLTDGRTGTHALDSHRGDEWDNVGVLTSLCRRHGRP
jgi:hypothetical protein